MIRKLDSARTFLRWPVEKTKAIDVGLGRRKQGWILRPAFRILIGILLIAELASKGWLTFWLISWLIP